MRIFKPIVNTLMLGFTMICMAILLAALLASSSYGAVAAEAAAISADEPAAPPLVDREGAEREFLKAYDYFLKGNMWNSLDDLSASLKANTYFVDVYFMEALVLRRIGRYPQAIRALESYIEVRHDDQRAAIILESMREEWREFTLMLHPKTVTSLIYFDPYRRDEFFRLFLINKLGLWGIAGLGKLSAMGKDVYVPDTLGNKAWVINRSATRSNVLMLPMSEPVAMVPLNTSEFLLFQKSGDVHGVRVGFSQSGLMPRRIGAVDANVADAVAIDSSLIAVADRTGGFVKFYGYPSLGLVAQWRPAEFDGPEPPEKLFEPIALAQFGQTLAVADRGNGIVHVLDAFTLKELDRFESAKPRDLEWGDQGELYVLGERGELVRRFTGNPDGQKTAVLVRGLENAWSITWSADGPIISDVGGQVWWNSHVTPGREETIGTVALHDPWITGKKGSETIHMRASVGSLFQGYVKHETPVTQVIWRNESRPNVLSSVPVPVHGDVWYYSPSERLPDGDVVTGARTMGQVMADVARKSRSGRPMPRVIVMDSRIETNEREATDLLAFLLQQGIRLDLWVLGRPATPSISRVSRITLGFTYYKPVREVIPFDENLEWVLSMPLPVDPVTFGYPSDAMFSLFADVNTIRFRDWLPVWPTLINRK